MSRSVGDTPVHLRVSRPCRGAAARVAVVAPRDRRRSSKSLPRFTDTISGGIVDKCACKGKGLSRRGLLRGVVGGGVLATGGASLLAGGGRAVTASYAAANRPRLEAPRVHSREEWGAVAARSRPQIVDRAPDRIVIHHTDTANSTDYSLKHAYRLSRSIQRFHMRGRGWSDSGQHFTISRGGHLMEGRGGTLDVIRGSAETAGGGKLDKPTSGTGAPALVRPGFVVGAHTLRHNERALGIENEGRYASTLPPERQFMALIELCAWICAIYRLSPDAIVAHRDLNDTTCPGGALYEKLPTLRWQVANRLSV